MTQVQEINPHQLTVEQAYDLWFTVPKRPPSKQERETVNRADNFTIPFQDLELAASQWGSGPTVLLLHGWGGHRGQLSAFVDPLVKAGYRVVSFDAPSHGDTPGTKSHGFEIAAVVLKVVEEIGPPHAIVAHSFGALVAAMALNEGLTANRLVFSGAMRRLSDALDWFASMTSLPPEYIPTMRTWIERDFGEDVWERTSTDKLVADVNIPALLFHDREDTITPFQSSQAIAKAWPGAELVATTGLGHRRILRDSQVIEQAVDFIGRS